MPFYRVRLLRTKGPTLVMILILAAGGPTWWKTSSWPIGAAGDSRTGPNGVFLMAAVFAISKFVVLVAVVAVLVTALVAGVFVRAGSSARCTRNPRARRTPTWRRSRR